MPVTTSTALVACLQEADMACPGCMGYGWIVTPEDALDLTQSPCPECKGTRMKPEYRQEPIERCEDCGEALDVAGQEPVCHRCAAEARCDFPYTEAS